MKSSILLLVAAAATACQAGLGRLPRHVVSVYDQGRPDGLIEIEAGRDGRIRELEVDIAVAALPGPVLAAARAALPGGEVTGAERELLGREEDGYEVKMRGPDGRDYEFVYTASGRLLEMEAEIDREAAPAAVLAAAEAAVPGGEFRSVERIERRGLEEYHVKFLRDRASYKVVLRPGGEVIRAVREARAEIEIPLRD